MADGESGIFSGSMDLIKGEMGVISLLMVFHSPGQPFGDHISWTMKWFLWTLNMSIHFEGEKYSR